MQDISSKKSQVDQERLTSPKILSLLLPPKNNWSDAVTQPNQVTTSPKINFTTKVNLHQN